MADVDARYQFAIGLIKDAGELAAGYFARVSDLAVRSKGVQDVVTEADVQVENMIKDRVEQAFPGDAFLGEETGASDIEGAAGIWVVDPIDGTQPFVSGMSNWCVSIAYVENGRLSFGLVHSPAAGELFAGPPSGPATLNGSPIALHTGTSITDGIVAVGYSPRINVDDILPVFDRLLRPGGTFFRSGSGALSLCYVACGRLLGYVEPHINSWDCLGAIAVITAAGGQVNDYLTPEALLDGNRIVAGPPAVFAVLDAILGSPAGTGSRGVTG